MGKRSPRESVGLEGGWWWSPRGLHLEVVSGQRSGSRAPLLGSGGKRQVVEAQAVGNRLQLAQGRELHQGAGPAQRQREVVPFSL